MLQPEVMVVVIDTPGVIQVTAAALSTASLRTVAGPGKGVSRRLDGAMLAADRRGVTALEYGIVATFLCLSLLGIFSRFGSVLLTMFSGVTTSI